LRLDGDGFAAAPQLAPANVKNLIGKDKLHRCRPRESRIQAIITAISRANQAAVKVFNLAYK
jgi:hypothetical protein